MLYTMVSGKVFDIIFTSYALKSHYNPQTNILNIGIIIVVKALLYCIITERCWCARSDNSVMDRVGLLLLTHRLSHLCKIHFTQLNF